MELMPAGKPDVNFIKTIIEAQPSDSQQLFEKAGSTIFKR